VWLPLVLGAISSIAYIFSGGGDDEELEDSELPLTVSPFIPATVEERFNAVRSCFPFLMCSASMVGDSSCSVTAVELTMPFNFFTFFTAASKDFVGTLRFKTDWESRRAGIRDFASALRRRIRSSLEMRVPVGDWPICCLAVALAGRVGQRARTEGRRRKGQRVRTMRIVGDVHRICVPLVCRVPEVVVVVVPVDGGSTPS